MSDFVNLNIMTHYSNADTLQMRPNRSASKPEDYVEELSNHKAIAFTENNNVYNWYSKKKLCDENGIKYIHGVTLNVVKSLEKESSVHHIILLAKNYEGVKEINELVGDSFEGRNNKDGELHHFYFVPRTSIDELRNVSDNVIMIVSGLNNPLWWTKRGNFNEENQLWLDFFEERKSNVWIGVSSSADSNEHMFANEYMKKLGFKMVLVNNTMSHKPEHEYLRYLLNKSQTQRYEENKEYLALKDYSEIIKGFKEQGTFNQDEVDELINETNVISDMVEEFEMDERLKYPQIFANPKQKIRELVNKGFVERGLDKLPPEELKAYVKQANHELEVMEKTQSIDYMLLEQYYKEEMRNKGVYHAPARGSAGGSVVAYLLQIIDIDPIKEGLIFERFMNEARITLADIDSDWSGEDRRTVQQFLLEHDDLYSAAIITYGTLGIKGAVKDVARALGTYSAIEANTITKEIKNIQGKDIVPSKLRDEHKLLFEYAESLLGIITNVGRHASAILVSDRDIFKEIGYVRVRDFDYPVTAWDMGLVEENKYVKLDILGVKVVEWVNKAVELAELSRITPQSDAIDFNDWDIRDDILNNGTATIFQLEEQEEATQQMLSPSSIKKIREYNPDIRLVELLSIITAVIRPGSDSIKDDVLEGNYHDYGVPEINDLLKDSFGHIIYQEQTIALIQYAGFSASEADVIRRAISKKNSDTINNWIPQFKETLIDKITTDYPEKNHDDVANMVDGLAQIIIDSSHYSFNKSHAIAYSYISMQTAWLRHHYPIEWITAGFIVWSGGSNLDKIKTLTRLARSYNISIEPARFGKSRGEYFFDKELNTIYEGTAPIKGLNKEVGDFLYTYKNNQYDYFLDFLMDITDPFVIKKAETDEVVYRGVDALNLSEEEVKEVDKAIKSGDLVVESLPTTTPNSAQMLALIRLDYFQSFGGSSYLEEVYQLYKKKYNKTNKTIKSKRKNYQTVKEHEKTLDNESDISFYDKANYEIKYLERCSIHDENIPSKYAIVVDIKGKNNYNVNATIRSINKGANIDIRIKSSLFRKVPIEPGDIIQIDNANKSPKNVKVDGSWVKSKTEFDNWVNDMKFIRKGIVNEK